MILGLSQVYLKLEESGKVKGHLGQLAGSPPGFCIQNTQLSLDLIIILERGGVDLLQNCQSLDVESKLAHLSL